jgi:hypothetical protein
MVLMIAGDLAVATPPRLSGDRLQFVDCLLPGQMRKLGGQMMYQGPRRPLRATVDECELRGGEYVAYDRADYGTALQVWLPEAEKGDTEAEVYVGQIYERGTGSGPDYALAAQWYAKAAAAGSAHAKNHLAYLYEQGLGVHQDAARAVGLYREAAGLTGDRLILASELTAREAELTARLDERTQALQKAAAELDHTREQLKEQREAAAKAERQAAGLRTHLMALQHTKAADSAQEVSGLRRDLSEREQFLAEQHRAVSSLEQSASQQGEHLAVQLASASAEDPRLVAVLGAARTQALTARWQLAALQARSGALEQAAALAREEARKLERAAERATPAQSRALAAESACEVAVARSLDLERQGLIQQVQRLQQSLAAAAGAASESTQASASLRAELASLESGRLIRTRQVTEMSLKVESDARELSDTRMRLMQAQGRLSAQDDALQALYAEREEREARLQKERALVKGLEAAVLSEQGQITDLRAQLSTKGVAPPVVSDREAPRPEAPAPANLDARGLGLGTSYALIIANAHYRDHSYGPLPSVQKDAQALDSALQRYGFKGHTTHVDNGTRDDIMNALAVFSAQLGPADSALIYYSGHGTLLEANSATYWLPSDADPESPASWVSTGWVTEMIGQMRARHVLVVVDSCYADSMVHSTHLRVSTRIAAAEPERLRFLAQLRSRTVLASGGNEPVAGAGPGGGSVFVRQLTQILERNSGVLDASSLYSAMAEAMDQTGASAQQLPRYSVLASTSHMNGDFLFVPGGGR